MEPQFNKFLSYKLTPEEELQGSILSPLQLAVLQNRRAQIAQDILNLRYDPSEPLKFVQADADSKGAMALLDWIILCHREAQDKLDESLPHDSSQDKE